MTTAQYLQILSNEKFSTEAKEKVFKRSFAHFRKEHPEYTSDDPNHKPKEQ